MSGGAVAYHLRPNKAVDRQLFVELLGRIQAFTPLVKHTYVGFGGPFLSDFQALHTQFGIDRMVSLETNANVFKRQQFNKPISCVLCTQQSSTSYIDNFSSKGPVIVWLDYTDPKKLMAQLGEYQSLLSKLVQGDVVRITLNTSGHALDVAPVPSLVVDRLQTRYERLSERIGDLVPNSIVAADMSDDKYPDVLTRVAVTAARRSVTKPNYFQPLLACAYADSQHTMLTVTGIVLKRGEWSHFRKVTGLAGWPFLLKRSGPVRVTVPVLSARERLLVDSLLPGATKRKIRQRLGFECDESKKRSLAMFDSYVKFYRLFPYFGRYVP